ncbi:DUF488 family protein [Leptolyngbyaceae cyanobacterium CCMR0082]|uniref:DUF488 family protein n=1 Tax=Adonisia turfae CCMR0082 TaxID=2304604 RepID=A0A6M0S0P9_9CYAN|nr:DUF488 family protein [Adonisia turfae]NEZ61522.1 DUF488 family protein [Adonisia turfae CCMR0082]
MKTSNFANNAHHNLQGISISRYPATRSGFTGPEFPPLFPDTGLLKDYKESRIDWSGYVARYEQQLSLLKADEAYAYLCQIAAEIGADEPVLLCFESAKTLDKQPCHRRLVAAWLEREIGVQVPEWAKQKSLLEAVA